MSSHHHQVGCGWARGEGAPWRRRVLAAIACGALTPVAFAQEGFQRDWLDGPDTPNIVTTNGTAMINIAGATLVAPIFRTVNAGITNDHTGFDVDGDGVSGFNGTTVDQLATDINSFDATSGKPIYSYDSLFSNNAQWNVHYRPVGSVNGYSEFLNYHANGTLPTSVPSGEAYINRVQFYNGGVAQTGGGKIPANTPRNSVGLPAGLSMNSVDIAVLDVPSAWGARGNTATGKWNKKPNQAGYGVDSRRSSSGFNLPLPSVPAPLNTNTASPDSNTLYDTDIAFVPVAILINRGVGVDGNNDGTPDGNMKVTDLQHGYVTGRTRSGENLAFGGRSAGSGTRNAIMNSLNIDPAWGNGDNVGSEFVVAHTAALGTGDVGSGTTFATNVPFQGTHAEASGGAETFAQNHRLAVSHTGIAGRVNNWGLGQWEVANLRKDIDGNGDSIQDNTSTNASAFVRPTLPNVIDPNASNAGFQWKEENGGADITRTAADHLARNPDGVMYEFGGPAAWVTRGDPESGRNGNTNPAMTNLAARDFLRNITDSTVAFTAAPTTLSSQFTPGQTVANQFSLPQSQDRTQSKLDPTVFNANTPNLALQQEVLQKSNWGGGVQSSVGAYGTSPIGGAAGLVPFRKGSFSGVTYTDGQTVQTNGTNGTTYIAGTNRYVTIDGTFLTFGQPLNARNEVAYDFNSDDRRNVSDIENMMAWAAIRGLNGFSGPTPASPETGTGLSLEIIADGNGDGNFDAQDIRYFADGLAMTVGSVKVNPDDPDTRVLDRKLGFTMVDEEWETLTGGADSNFFNVSKSTWTNGLSNFYNPGDARGDVFGDTNGDSVLARRWLSEAIDGVDYNGDLDTTDTFAPDVQPGAFASGADGVIDKLDVQYVYDQFLNNPAVTDNVANWDDIDEAISFDLSADMDGDLDVDIDDVKELVGTQLFDLITEDSAYPNETLTGILHAQPGDFDLDGDVDFSDLNIWEQFAGTVGNATFMMGDADFDFDVDFSDLNGIEFNLGQFSHAPEPGVLTALGAGLLGLGRRRRRSH